MVHSTTLSWLQKGHLNTLSRVVFFLITIFFVLFFRRPIAKRAEPAAKTCCTAVLCCVPSPSFCFTRGGYTLLGAALLR